MKKYLAEKFDIDIDYIDIVCLEEGRIHKDSTHMVDIPRPLKVMVGNPDREAFTTVDTKINKKSSDKHKITMSCGHSISKI